MKLAAGAAAALAIAVAAGAAGSVAASLALSDDDETRPAATLREGIGPVETPLLFGGFGRGFGIFAPFGDLDAAAAYLELTRSELREQLSEGKTLAEIARDEGKPVDGLVQAMAEAAEERIDDAIADGRLSEDRADDLKRELEERLTDVVTGELRIPPLRELRSFDFGPGWFDRDRFREGPHGFRGPRG